LDRSRPISDAVAVNDAGIAVIAMLTLSVHSSSSPPRGRARCVTHRGMRRLNNFEGVAPRGQEGPRLPDEVSGQTDMQHIEHIAQET